MAEEKGIHPNYQKYMDLVYWLKAYSQRTGASVFSSFDEKTSDQIMDDVLSGNPLHTNVALNATFSPILFDGSLIEPLLNSPHPFARKDFSDDCPTKEKLRTMLADVAYAITEIRANEALCGRKPGDVAAHKIEVIGIDCEKSLESVLGEVEILWLENNGLAREAYLRRIALRFLGKTNVSGPYVSRAVGLWLWDCKNSGGKSPLAAFRRRYHNHDELLKYDDATLRFFYQITNECIKARDVLPMTKNKKGYAKKNPIPGN